MQHNKMTERRLRNRVVPLPIAVPEDRQESTPSTPHFHETTPQPDSSRPRIPSPSSPSPTPCPQAELRSSRLDCEVLQLYCARRRGHYDTVEVAAQDHPGQQLLRTDRLPEQTSTAIGRGINFERQPRRILTAAQQMEMDGHEK